MKIQGNLANTLRASGGGPIGSNIQGSILGPPNINNFTTADNRHNQMGSISPDLVPPHKAA